MIIPKIYFEKKEKQWKEGERNKEQWKSRIIKGENAES